MNLKTIVVGADHLTPKQEKFRKAFMYLVSGGITTLVSLTAFKIFGLFLPDFTLSVFGLEIPFRLAINKVLCWILSVLVAYFLNRITVFRSKGKILSELMKFAGARVLSFLLFEEGLFLLSVYLCTKATGLPGDTVVVTILNLPITYEDIMNLINLAFVVIANYIMSKLMVFKKEDMVGYGENGASEEASDEKTETDAESEAEPDAEPEAKTEEGTENA